MAKLVSPPAPNPPQGVVEQTITQKQLIPAPPQPAPPESKPRQDKNTLSEWFAALHPEERADLWYYYIKRMDPNIKITNENFEGGRGGKYLYKLTIDDVRQLSSGDFEAELSAFLSEKFGGGMYSLLAVHKTFHNRIRNAVLEVDGAPRLSEREGWKDGRPPITGESASVLPELIRMVRDEIRQVGQHQKSPEESVGSITQTILNLNQEWSKQLVTMMPKAPTAAEQLQQTMQLLEGMQRIGGAANNPAAANADPFSQFNNVLNVVQKVRELDRPAGDKPIADVVREVAVQVVRESGGGRRGGSDYGWVAVALDKLGPALTRVAEAGVEYLRYRSAAAAPGRAMPRAQQFPTAAPSGMPQAAAAPAPNAAPAPGFIPPAGRVNPSTIPAPEASAAPADPGEGGPLEISPEVANEMLLQYAAQRILDALQHDTPGDAVAESLSIMFPQVAVMMRFMTTEQIMAYVRSNPILAAAQNDPRLPQFIEQFVSYFKPEPETEGKQE